MRGQRAAGGGGEVLDPRVGEGEAEDFASDQTGCAYEEKSRHQDETRAGIGAAANGIGRGGTKLGK
jgi:hypothetical protein